MKRPKISSKKISWFTIASVFLLAIAIAVGGVSAAQAASGSFDRDKYLPSLGDSTNDFDRAWFSVTDSAANTTSVQDTLTVTVKSGTSEASFVLKESGTNSTVFTTTGSAQPTRSVIGSTTGYVEDFLGSHRYFGLGTGTTGLNLKSFASASGGSAETASDGTVKVASGETLLLLYGGSTLDTASISFNGANTSSFTLTEGVTWGNDGTTVSSDSENFIVTISDPDVNLNPQIKEVIGFQDPFTIPSASFSGTGSSRVRVSAIDQNNVDTTLSIGGTSTVATNIMLVESGLNTGVFTATGKVYGTSSINPNVNLRGNVKVDINRDGSFTVGNFGSTTTLTTIPDLNQPEVGYLGGVFTVGTTTGTNYVNVQLLEFTKNGHLALSTLSGTGTAQGQTILVYTTDSTVPGSASSATAGTQTDKVVAYGTRSVRYFPGLSSSNASTAWSTSINGTTTVFGSVDSNVTRGLVKLMDGEDYCLLVIQQWYGTESSWSITATASAYSIPSNPSSITDGRGVGSGSVAIQFDSFALYGPRSGDTIKVSYLDEMNSGGTTGTITGVKVFGTTGETGTLSVDKTTVDINDFLTVTVVDGNLNASTSSKESVASGSWNGTTTNNRGDRLTIAGYNSTGKKVSLSYPEGSSINGTQTIRISNSDSSLVWIVPTNASGFVESSAIGSSTFNLGTQSTSASAGLVPLVKGSANTANSFLTSAQTSSFVATLDAVDNTVEISPDGTYWVAIPITETGANSSTFVGTIGFDFTSARITTNTTRTAANTFTNFTGTTTVMFDTDMYNSTFNLTSYIGTGSVVKISDGTFSEIQEVSGVSAANLTVTKMTNGSFFTPWKTWVQVVGNDMATGREDTLSSGPKLFRIGGYYGATYRVRYNDASVSGNAYSGGDSLAATTSNVGFTTYTGSLEVAPSGTVGLNSEIVLTVVDNDLNTSSTVVQSTFNNTASIQNLNEAGLGFPSGTSTGNISNSVPFKNGGTAKQIFASRATSITSSDFTNTGNTVSIKLVETAVDSGTFKGTLKLTGITGSSTTNDTSPAALKVSNGDTVTIFLNDSPSATAENNLSSYTTVSMSAVGGAGSLSLSKSEAFLSGDTVVVTLIDNDLNTTSAIDTNATAVSALSSSETASTPITMTETAVNAGTFKGTFSTGNATVGGSAPTVRAVASGTITVTYSDSSPAQDITAKVTTKNYGATLAFTTDSVAISGNAVVSLYDPETNTSISSANLVNVAVKSTTDSTGTTVRLTETGVDTGSFLGTIKASTDSTVVNSNIKAAVGDTLTTTFTDNPNASGSISTATDTALVEAAAATPTPTPGPATPTPPGQTPTPTPTPLTVGGITGTVVDITTTAPIAGATVSTDTGGYSATTDAAGSYTIADVAAGDYTVTAAATGYDSSSQPVTVVAGAVASANFALAPTLPTTPTPTVTPTPSVVCEPESVSVSPTSLSLKRKKSGGVTVTVTGADNCAVEGETVTATINAAGKKRISTTSSATTDASGEATFTITAKKKTGRARVTFKAGSVKKSMTVRVKK